MMTWFSSLTLNDLAPATDVEADVKATPVKKTVRGKVRSFGFDVDTKAYDGESAERRISGYASTPNVDRMREVIDVSAYKATIDGFQRNPIMLLQHRADQPIGKFDTFELREEGLWVSGVVAKGTQLADETWNLITQGVLRTFSVGFIELDGDYDENKTWHITNVELLETSVVSIPANREAVFSFEDGKCVHVELLPTEVEKLADNELIVEAKRRGILPPEPPESQVRSLLRGWKSGVCAGCGAEGLVLPFAEVREYVWSLCPSCVVPQEVMVMSQDAVTELAKRLEVQETRSEELEAVVVSLLEREVKKLAQTVGVTE